MKKYCFGIGIVAMVVAIFFFTGCKKDFSPANTSLQDKKTNQSMADPLVATPAGLMPKSHIHLVENGYSLQIKGGHVLKILTKNGKLIADFGKIVAPGNTTGIQPNSTLPPNSIGRNLNRSNIIPPTPTTSPGWMTWSEWKNTSGQPINYFSTNWLVPGQPITGNSQVIYIFNGLSKSDRSDLIQPVLQWGFTPAGGGYYWGIVNWYAWTSVNSNNQVDTYAAFSPLIQVSPNTSLKGIITYTGQSSGSYNYTSAFDGYSNVLNIVQGDQYTGYKNVSSNVQITIPQVQQEVWAFEALEAYNYKYNYLAYDVSTPTDYPAAQDVQMTNINLQINYAPAIIYWTPEIGQYAQFGEHTNIINYSSPSGEVDLYFHPPTVNINGQGSYDWNNGSGSGSGNINAPVGTLVHVTVSAYGPGTLTNFTMNGAQLSGLMGNSIYIQNNSTTQTFTMPASGYISWNGYFQQSGSSGTGHISVN